MRFRLKDQCIFGTTSRSSKRLTGKGMTNSLLLVPWQLRGFGIGPVAKVDVFIRITFGNTTVVFPPQS
jgi:hypothetical protein